jgi:2-polyprenyl-3-methyl-5-hydroxy-6-metoxy-1,4-benzoquinol methylase
LILRRVRPEEMDRPDANPAELKRSLRDLEAVNRWLGGRRSAVSLVLGLAQKVPTERVTVLDLGSGAADIPRALVREAARIGIDLRVTATDIHPKTLAFARAAVTGEARIQVEAADATDLHYPDASFDLVMANTMLHHFPLEQAKRVLREMERVGRWGLVVSDLARSRLALLGAEVLAATVWRGHPITRHDGPASVRAAFTTGELRELARKSLTGPCVVRSHPVFRLSLTQDLTGTDR